MDTEWQIFWYLKIFLYNLYITFWVKIFKCSYNCILKHLYEVMYYNPCHNSWVSNVKDLLCSLGFSNVWYLQRVHNLSHLFAMVKQRLFIQEMNAFFEKSSKCYIYRYLTDSFGAILCNHLRFLHCRTTSSEW
jgi:hypothetical protein